MNRSTFFALIFLMVTSLITTTCDMTFVSPSPEDREITQNEREELEKNGRFLKITHMPVNIQITNVASVSVANSVSTIARRNQNDHLRVFRDTDTSTVYIPLVYNDDSEFTETGSFYVAFTIHVDALVSYIVTLTDKVVVPFTDGRGELDVRTLPVSGQGNLTPELTETDRDELEKNGHFLKLTYMPLHTQIANVSSTQVANSAAAIARLNQNDHVRIFRNTDTSTVYLPLIYNNDSEFTETGSFYVALTVHVDALVSYIVTLTDKVVVPFTNGRGELDVRTLPVSGQGNSTPELTENERNELEKNGHFLKLTYMPLHTQSANVASVQIANSVSSVATIDKNQSIRIFRETDTSTVYIPLVYFDNTEFIDNGSFYTAFSIHVDAVTSYVVTVTDKILVPFVDGRGKLDVRTLPYGGIVASDRRYLTIYNLPLYLLPQNVSNVSVNNRYGPVAHCEDYSLVNVSTFNGSSTVSIPLSFVNSTNSVFTGTGSFYIAFDLFLDALTHYTVTANDLVLVYFFNGNGYLDINDLITSRAAEHRYLTITNLPANLLPRNVANAMIQTQTGPLARVESYDLIEVFPAQNNTTSARIPLYYISPPEVFSASGDYFVVLDINIDANTRYTVTAQDRIMVSFLDGNGSFDINDFIVSRTAEHRYLTITNLPSNMLAQNVSNVTIRNQSGAVAQCEDYNFLAVSVSAGKASVRIPLVFTNPPAMFTGTGNFIITFNINIDANTSYTVTSQDNVQVSFTNGNGTFDITNIPVTPPPERRYLTITNLPSNMSAYNISTVQVHNQAGPVAQCNNYNLIEVSVSDGKASVLIPLVFTNSSSMFTGTGNFIISFDINVDAETRYLITKSDNVQISFNNGNGSLDINNIPQPQTPYLTINELPFHTTKGHISDVSVYNLAGQVAQCSNYNNIVITRNNDYATVMIPLSSSSGNGYFHDTGRFAVSFSVNVDIDTQILFRQNDGVYLQFTDGSAVLDIMSTYGFFSADLVNPSDAAAPIIKQGSIFEVDGYRHTVANNVNMANYSNPSAESCILYLYAFRAGSIVFYEYSKTAPTYNMAKNGWYKDNGSKRALWKMIYLYNSNPPQFLFKTYINNDFPHLGTTVLTNDLDYSQIISSGHVSKSINGANNLPPETVTLDPGLYVIELKGAGGGGGYVYNGMSSGGSGGSVREIINLNAETSFTAFTGSGGGNAPPAPTSGSFNIVTTKNYYSYYTYLWDSHDPSSQRYMGNELHSTDTILQTVTSANINNTMSGGGGGGGGSGTFLYCSSENYLLLAGGGGGGSGGSYLTPGGAGGAGGSVGPGAGGGGSGWLSQISDVETNDIKGNWVSSGGAGGSGGGYGGGSAGVVAGNGGEAQLLLEPNVWRSGGSGTASYFDSDFSVLSGIPFLRYTNFTHTANSSGGTNSANGSSESTEKIVSVRTTFSVSGNSGSGGHTAAISYLSGPQAWLNTNDAGGNGADALPLNPVSVTGTITPNGSYDTVNPQYTGNNSGPGTNNSNWNNSGTNASDTKFASDLTLSIGAARDGQPGSAGGNNRTTTRGGGSESGLPGTIIIYKIK